MTRKTKTMANCRYLDETKITQLMEAKESEQEDIMEYVVKLTFQPEATQRLF